MIAACKWSPATTQGTRLRLTGGSWTLFRNMDNPPAEAFEASWLQARDILRDAGPESAILLLTVRTEDGDLSSKVVLSSGYQNIPTRTGA